MKDNTKWWAKSWNPWVGCSKKTFMRNGQVVFREECRNCYMHRRMGELRQNANVVRRTSPQTFNGGYKLQRAIEAGKHDPRNNLVFVCSWSDFFNPEADDWRYDAWQAMYDNDKLIYLILTKLPQRIPDHLPCYWEQIRERVCLGTTVGMPGLEDEASYLLPDFGARALFVSAEPLLGRLDLSKWKDQQIDWLIVGGESGAIAKARPCHPEWVRETRDWACAHGIAFFFKQWGAWRPVDVPGDGYDRERIILWTDGTIERDVTTEDVMIATDEAQAFEYGSHFSNSNELDGGQWLAYPPDFPCAELVDAF